MEAAVKMARLLAIAHIVVGVLLICLGVVDVLFWSTNTAIYAICFGVWVSDLQLRSYPFVNVTRM